MWEFELAGDTFDLDELVLSMGETDPSIRKTKHGYVLQSAAFNQLDSHKDVETSANAMLFVLSGICAVLLSTRRPIQVAAISRVEPDMPRQTFVTVSDGFHARATMTMTVTNPDGSVEVTRPADPAVDWLQLATANTQIGRVFRLLNDPHLTWGAMYKIYEIIVGGTGQIADQGWASQAAMKRFKRSANSPSAAGDHAQHGVQSTEPPSSAMAQSEAKALIDTLVHNWLRATAYRRKLRSTAA